MMGANRPPRLRSSRTQRARSRRASACGCRECAPSRIWSSSLQPVVIWMISLRCSATMEAVVKPMGTIFQAAGCGWDGGRGVRGT